jgi:hypothetical protein
VALRTIATTTTASRINTTCRALKPAGGVDA